MDNINHENLIRLEYSISGYRNKELLLKNAVDLCERKRLMVSATLQSSIPEDGASDKMFDDANNEYIVAQEIVAHLKKKMAIELAAVQFSAKQFGQTMEYEHRPASP